MVLVQKEIFMVSLTFLVFIVGVGVNTVYLSIVKVKDDREEEKVITDEIGCVSLLLSFVFLIIFFNRLIPFLQHYEDFEEDDTLSIFTVEERFTLLTETG